MFKPTLALLAATIAAGAAAAPAIAQDDGAPRITIRYSDLDLATADGRGRLDTRVRVAIRAMCNSEPRQSLRQREASLECEAQARRSVDPQLASLLKGSSARFASEKPPVVAAP
ncbi:UrcA family protein [Sphingopyxis sp.]|uniref:UrcA family protein n=1 Tax=Sphingopyxis sp. TaxID=1908224 RepID=UPI003D0CB736